MTDVTLPDGTIATFPDEMSNEAISSAVQAHLQKQAPASNTWTGISRGFGQMLGPVGEAALIEQQAPSDVYANSKEISDAATKFALGGKQAYKPQTPTDQMYQDVVANTTSSIPQMLAFGPFAGLRGAVTTGLSNLGGNVGGEAGQFLWQDHPVAGHAIGSLLGGMMGAGMGPAAKSASTAAVSAAPTAEQQQAQGLLDQLKQNYSSGYVPQYARDQMASLEKQLSQPTTPPAVPSQPGLLSRLNEKYNKMIPEDYRFIPPLLFGEGVKDNLKSMYGLLGPYGTAAILGGGAVARGVTRNPGQAAQGIASGLLPFIGNYDGTNPYSGLPF